MKRPVASMSLPSGLRYRRKDRIEQKKMTSSKDSEDGPSQTTRTMPTTKTSSMTQGSISWNIAGNFALKLDVSTNKEGSSSSSPRDAQWSGTFSRATVTPSSNNSNQATRSTSTNQTNPDGWDTYYMDQREKRNRENGWT